MTLLEEAFQKENYRPISFSLNAVGHPTISLKVRNETATFLLDTGAASNILDEDFAKKIGLTLIPTGQKGGGAGGLIHDIYSVGNLEIYYEDLKFIFDQFFSMNFLSIKEAFKAKGVKDEFQGILGFGFFKQNNCFIDYTKNRIYVKTQ